jgi:translation initiation factor eIF-2B subunit alpha
LLISFRIRPYESSIRETKRPRSRNLAEFSSKHTSNMETKEGQQSDILRTFKALVSDNMAVPVAAMWALNMTIKDSKAFTWMELESELRLTIDILKKNCSCDDLGGRTNISLGSGCDLFMKNVTRAFSLEFIKFESCREELLRRGENLFGWSMNARNRIADMSHSFIKDDCTVLVHGSSRVATALIIRAAQSKSFSVIVTEGKPITAHFNCYDHAKEYVAAGIPTKIILDSAVGAVMEQVDIVIMGAEGVMENGGIINKIGTYQIALCAKALQRPFYVAVESYKFARMYPLSQTDIQTLGGVSLGGKPASSPDPIKLQYLESVLLGTPLSSPDKLELSTSTEGAVSLTLELPTIDFTPANLITLLFTDIGVLTPAAVSDELIRLYQ